MRERDTDKNLQNGDASALDELISMYYREILRYCIWHAPDPPQAERCSTETFEGCEISWKFRIFQ